MLQKQRSPNMADSSAICGQFCYIHFLSCAVVATLAAAANDARGERRRSRGKHFKFLPLDVISAF